MSKKSVERSVVRMKIKQDLFNEAMLELRHLCRNPTVRSHLVDYLGGDIGFIGTLFEIVSANRPLTGRPQSAVSFEIRPTKECDRPLATLWQKHREARGS